MTDREKQLCEALRRIERITFDPMQRTRTGCLQAAAVGRIQQIIRDVGKGQANRDL